jgi:hypothetical protein
MTNKPKNRGTAAESAVVKWLHTNGYPDARRQPPTGNKDQGDLWVNLRTIAEVKTRNTAAGLGQPGEAELAKWMAETEAERVNAGAWHAVLIVKRRGTSNPGRWFAYVPATYLANQVAFLDPTNAPISMDLATWVRLMRAGAFG